MYAVVWTLIKSFILHGRSETTPVEVSVKITGENLTERA